MGVEQAEKLPVAEPGPSRRHSKLELDSLELKLKLGSLFEVGPWARSRLGSGGQLCRP